MGHRDCELLPIYGTQPFARIVVFVGEIGGGAEFQVIQCQLRELPSLLKSKRRF